VAGEENTIYYKFELIWSNVINSISVIQWTRKLFRWILSRSVIIITWV